MHSIILYFFNLLLGEERENMMAKLWATEILSAATIEEAKALWARCPRLLKAKVQALLVASDADLAAEIIGE